MLCYTLCGVVLVVAGIVVLCGSTAGAGCFAGLSLKVAIGAVVKVALGGSLMIAGHLYNINQISKEMSRTLTTIAKAVSSDDWRKKGIGALPSWNEQQVAEALYSKR